MIKSYLTLLMVIVFTVFVSGAAFAGAGSDPSMKDKSHSMLDTSKTGTLFHQSQRLSKLIGTEVLNRKGEILGKIDDLVTAGDGRVHYLIIARGGVMGIGEKLVPVPIAQVPADLTNDGKCFIDIDKTVFDKAPGFASKQWPDLASMEWEAESRGYFSNTIILPPAATVPREETEKDEGSGY
jgi:sporulation protein YlmC with PRC-barrel domain